MFFKAISEVLDFQLSGILRKISTQTHLLGIDEKELPYLREENMANFSLLRGLYLNKVVKGRYFFLPILQFFYHCSKRL